MGEGRLERLEGAGVTVCAECLHLPDGPWDRAVASPGIPLEHPWQKQLRDAGVPVESELQVGWEALQVPGVVVTGSLGKTSATTVLAGA